MNVEMELYEKLLRVKEIAEHPYETKSRIVSLYDYMQEPVPQDMLPPPVIDEEVRDRVQALKVKYMVTNEPKTAAEGDSVQCASVTAAAYIERPILLYPGKSLPAAEQAEQDVLGKAIGQRFATTLCGRDIELEVRRITRREETVIDDALIRQEGIEGVETVAAYTDWCRRQLAQEKLEKAAEKLAGHLFNSLIEKSEFEIDEQECDAWCLERARMYFDSDVQRGDADAVRISQDPALLKQELEKIATDFRKDFRLYLGYIAVSHSGGIVYDVDKTCRRIVESAKMFKLNLTKLEEVMARVNMRYFLEAVYLEGAKEVLRANCIRKLSEQEG